MGWILQKWADLLVRLTPVQSERLARVFAAIWFRFLRIRRGLMLQNLKVAFPELGVEAHRKIAEESLGHFLMTVFEFLRAPVIDPVPDVEVVGREHLVRALEKNQGVYVLCFHLGNWEVMGATMTRLIAPSYVLVKKVGFGSLDRFVSQIRQTIGFLTVARKKKGDGFARIKEILGRGEIVGFVMDQARPGEPKLPFFGKPAKTNTSLAAIHQKMSAPIVPGYMIRRSFGKHTLVFEPELLLPVTGDEKQDIVERSILFNRVVEEAVRRAPQCYFWLHNRWK